MAVAMAMSSTQHHNISEIAPSQLIGIDNICSACIMHD